MLFKSLISVAVFTAAASAKIFYAGVAESSGEFGVYSQTKQKGFGLPGRFGVDYSFIDKKGIDVYVDQNKVNLFRIAFLLERMCPLSYGLGAKFNETHFDYFKEAVDYVTKTKGAYCILDPHNYMRYNDPSQQPMTGSIIGDTSDKTAATTAQFGAFWGELAGRFKDNEKVIFGLMNEPHDMKTSLVIQNNQAAIDGIRKAGAKQLILAPGNSWTGGHSWTEGSDPSTQLTQLKDPESNTAFDIHEYLDSDFSGSHAACAQSVTKLSGVTSWLKQNNYKAMITEFGGSNTTQCASMLTDFIKYMDANDVYIGWTAWAAGPFWGSASACCTDSKQWGSLEPTSKASDGSPGLYETVWLKTIQPLVPKQLVWSGMSSVKGGTVTTKPVRK
ncbi:glycoside hydrolase family 5 protein [Lindgomyces ingoldianus]|uniref:Glycoside hydrolase family 5 protein n=1 Tax=Lindgomyces ingoldianus TaxID=673940 RepID=A0ACB6QY34_9PLEO|nr:glycoside hydrolase family 5 protein [Lindgomyces ingoldianus]KAF2471899.1 glycoside hydrolase family 5 protein [Lindgomyces ingoldianus]